MQQRACLRSQPTFNSDNFLSELCTCNNFPHRHCPTNRRVRTTFLRTSPPPGTTASPPPVTPWRTSHRWKDSPQRWETPQTLWSTSPRHGTAVKVRTSVICLNQAKRGRISPSLLLCSRIRGSLCPRSRHSPVPTWHLTRSSATGWATRTHSSTDKLTQTPPSIPEKPRFTSVTARCGSNSTDTKQKWSLPNRGGKSTFLYSYYSLLFKCIFILIGYFIY